MEKFKIGDLQNLMRYTHEVKLSYDAVTFRGDVPDPYTGTSEPFFIGREISKLSADERATLFDLILPNGEKFSALPPLHLRWGECFRRYSAVWQ